MNKKSLRKSRYLKQADCDPPIRLTIAAVKDETVEFQGKEPENCSVMYFEETDKVLILRPVHADAIAEYCGTTDYNADDESDKWVGHTLEFYKEPNVTMGSKRVGGIRIRPFNDPAAGTIKAIKGVRAAQTVEDDDDDIDFGPPDDLGDEPVKKQPVKEQPAKQPALKMEVPYSGRIKHARRRADQ